MTQQLIAFNGIKKNKTDRIKQVKDKIANGQLMHGTYGEERNGKMMGCAVFVTTCNSTSPHQLYESVLGIPIALAKLEDVIFEHLKAPHDEQWPVRFLEAIPVGADLSRVSPKFQYWLMQENLKHEALWRKHDKKNEYVDAVVATLKQVAEIMKKWAETGEIDESAAWSAARSAWSARSAESAAWSAESAAWSARSAESAAWSARSAESAAWSAESAAWSAESAGSAAWSAARSDFYIRASEKLSELMSQAPVVVEVRE